MLDNFIKYVGKNFGNPKGITGIIMTKIMNIMNQKLYTTVLNNLKLETNDFALDIGFGNGYLIKRMFKKNIPIKVYGIEISNDMVNNVSSKNRRNINSGNLTIFLENIEKTSFENNTFDKIVTINTIYFWNNYEKCFSEIKRILKPNGIFYNTIFTKYFLDKFVFTKYGFNKYSIEEIENLTKNNGMKIIETKEIIKNKSYCIISTNV